MKKKKKKSIFPLILLIVIVAAIFLFSSNHKNQKNENTLEKLGYSKEAITVLNKLKQNQLDTILKTEKQDYIEKLVTDENFQIELFDSYIDYYQNNQTSIEDTIIHVNAKTVSSSDDEITVAFKQAKYYLATNLDRYLAYAENYPDLPVETVIRYINSNLDYEYYTHVTDSDLTKETLMIVNKYHKVSQNYVPDNLITIENNYGGNGKSIQEVAYPSYKEMYDAALQEGLHLSVSSAYRSFSYQQGLYNNYVAQNGFEEAETFSARPGYSEHQTGLAIDFCTSACRNLGDFEGTKEFYWMKENSYKYGWILRYPEEDVKITGYTYEPWHYRYVGMEAAKIIHDNNLTYEEYYAYYVE